jgi:hypothetical protein
MEDFKRITFLFEYNPHTAMFHLGNIINLARNLKSESNLKRLKINSLTIIREILKKESEKKNLQ